MKRALIGILLAGLVGLVWLSLHLAGLRIYQVDECAEVYSASLLASGQAKQMPNVMVGLLQFPLSWLARHTTRSAELFDAGRFIMVEIFWLNLVLLAVATGEKLLSMRGLVALLAAATLAPLWDYGFEIRHDNLLLTGLLLTWCAVRVRPSGIQSYLLAGAIAVAMQAAAHKAFAYFIPLTFCILLFPPPGHRQPRWKLALAWVAGAFTAFVLLALLYKIHGLGLTEFSGTGVKIVSEVTVNQKRLWPGDTLARLLSQTPLLLALLAAAAAAALLDLRRRGRTALTWDSSLPEGVLFFGALGLLVINPTPYPYNLLHLVPYAFLFAYRYVLTLTPEFLARPALALTAVAVLLFTHLVIFGMVTRRHLERLNYRQVFVMDMAEDLTDAGKDPVFDGVGLVPTRRVIHPDSFLHGLSAKRFTQKDGPHVRDMLAANPAPVIILNYRTDWLRDEDQTFIREHYVPLADDFWVLGKILPAGGGVVEIIRPGRYRLNPAQTSCISGTVKLDEWGQVTAPTKTNCAGALDGAPWPDRAVELSAGAHRIETAADCQPTVVWVGPRLDSLHPISAGDRRRLFANWY